MPTLRKYGYDYSKSAVYFITISTKNKKPFFGEIHNGRVELTEIGNVAYMEWEKIPEYRTDMNISLREFVIMPDHMHGILVIGDNAFNSEAVSEGFINDFKPQSKNLGSIIRGYKSKVKSYANSNDMSYFEWQSGFHDVIIHDESSYWNHTNYILQNPANANVK